MFVQQPLLRSLSTAGFCRSAGLSRVASQQRLSNLLSFQKQLFMSTSSCASQTQVPAVQEPTPAAATAAVEKINLSGLNRQELASALAKSFSSAQIPSYRIEQLFEWIYSRGVREFAAMSNLPQKFRDTLAEKYRIDYCDSIIESRKSSDGTRKYLLQFKNSAELAAAQRQQKQETNEKPAQPSAQGAVQIECVYIPEVERGTMCVSSQVGCSLACRFCHTGTQALERNLRSFEIVNQVMHAKSELLDFPENQKQQQSLGRLTNIVFMGQGEPLYNYREVKKAIEILTDQRGLALPPRKIVVSTSGVVPALEKLANELPSVNIAISLHATTNEIRDQIVPLNKTFPLDLLMSTIRSLPNLKTSHEITFEYTMLKGVNDSFADVDRLAKLLDGIPCSVNLIPFNTWEGAGFTCPSQEHIIAFSSALYDRGIRAPIRWSRGDDVLAACGQLRSTSRLKEEYIQRLAEQQAKRDQEKSKNKSNTR